jgi:hypothetical protein
LASSVVLYGLILVGVIGIGKLFSGMAAFQRRKGQMQKKGSPRGLPFLRSYARAR